MNEMNKHIDLSKCLEYNQKIENFWAQKSLEDLFEEFGTAPIKVENYLGEEMEITIENISNQNYGWPEQHFTGQEGNLIIQF